MTGKFCLFEMLNLRKRSSDIATLIQQKQEKQETISQKSLIRNKLGLPKQHVRP
jgi:hypothetical protein